MGGGCFFRKKKKKKKKKFYWLKEHTPAKQCALLLFRYALTSYLTFLLRSCTPLETYSVCSLVETEFRRTFCDTFHLPTLSDQQWQQLSLPLKMGGLGFTSPSMTAFTAFCASISTFCNVNLPVTMPSFHLPSFLSRASLLASSLSSLSPSLFNLLYLRPLSLLASIQFVNVFLLLLLIEKLQQLHLAFLHNTSSHFSVTRREEENC